MTESPIAVYKTIHGDLAIDTVADAKMAAVFARGEYHQGDTIELLSKLVTAETIFVDGGAHIGTITVPLARLAKKTIAFEADPYTAKMLRENIARNSVNAEVREKGIGREPGRAEVASVREGNAGAHTLTVGAGGIEIVTLDSELDRFDLLKLDVEGMELEVFEGARRIFKEAHPTTYFEVNLSQLRAHSTRMSDLDAFFDGLGYRLYLPFRLSGELVLGDIPNISVIAACMYPGAYFLRRTSSVFDVLALPKDSKLPLSIVSTPHTFIHVLRGTFGDKVRRLKKIFS